MEITEAQIKKWKAKYGDVYAITVNIEEDTKATAYFRKPDLQIISAAAKFADIDPIKSGNIMLENCWLAGDEIIKEDEEAKLGVIKKLGELFKIKEAEIKKL
ncbi:MAG: hypothetical protein KatS3mg034_1358 [Vicingaceae bacterium]|nr:MAG: hypothetical protein KatS3mg034_1358 [Vicingaceae bacterium]